MKLLKCTLMFFHGITDEWAKMEWYIITEAIWFEIGGFKSEGKLNFQLC